MRKFSILMMAAMGLLATSPSYSHETCTLSQATTQVSTLARAWAVALNVIDWKVGDNAQFNLKLMNLPFGGSMTMEATKDEGNAIWMRQETNMLIQRQAMNLLFNKADGQILKVVDDNGQEMQMPEDEIEVISQDYGDITVPAGTFKALHITAKSKQFSAIEMWANPQLVALGGMIKQIATQAQQGGGGGLPGGGSMTITVELKSFKKQ